MVNSISVFAAFALGTAVCVSSATLPAAAAEPKPPIALNTAPEKVAVLDAGDFFSVEAHNATVAEVLEALKKRLRLTFTNLDRIDLARVVDGTRVGNIQHIMAWLVPTGGFVVFYEEQKPGVAGRPERISFLQGGTPTAGLSGQASSAAAAQAEADAKKAGTGKPQATASASGGGATAAPDGANKAGKPDVPDTGGRHEYLTVPEQLAAATVNAQMDIDRQANDPTGQSPLPSFLNGPGNVANTTLEQQMQRSQALATAQLQALQSALRAACRGGANAPC